jgi:DNA primase
LFGQRPKTARPPQGSRAPFVKGQRPIEGPVTPTAATKGSDLVAGSGQVAEVLREAVILATLINHPALVVKFERDLERLDLIEPVHDTLRGLILRHAAAPDFYDQIQNAAPAGLEELLARPHVQSAPCVRNRDDQELATLCLAEEFAKLTAHRGARREIEDAVEDLEGLADEGLTWRLSKAAEARHRADNPTREDAADLGEDRSAMMTHLQNLIDGQVWVKKKH